MLRLMKEVLECEDREGLKGKPAETAVRRYFLQSVPVVKDAKNLVRKTDPRKSIRDSGFWINGKPLERSMDTR